MLQQAVLSTRDEVIIQALSNLNYRGRLQSNKFLMVRQIIQNFNTMEKLSKHSVSLDLNNKDPRNAAAEHYLQTIPRLQEIQNKSPNT